MYKEGWNLIEQKRVVFQYSIGSGFDLNANFFQCHVRIFYYLRRPYGPIEKKYQYSYKELKI